MAPLEVLSVQIEHFPGHPSQATVELRGGLRLGRIQVWPARHGPLVLFPLGQGGRFLLDLTPLLRGLVVRSVVSAWRNSLAARAAA
jgi:hypothetical protein